MLNVTYSLMIVSTCAHKTATVISKIIHDEQTKYLFFFSSAVRFVLAHNQRYHIRAGLKVAFILTTADCACVSRENWRRSLHDMSSYFPLFADKVSRIEYFPPRRYSVHANAFAAFPNIQVINITLAFDRWNTNRHPF